MTNVMGFKKPVSAQQQVKNLKTSKDESIHGALRDVVEAQALARGGLTDLHIQKGTRSSPPWRIRRLKMLS